MIEHKSRINKITKSVSSFCGHAPYPCFILPPDVGQHLSLQVSLIVHPLPVYVHLILYVVMGRVILYLKLKMIAFLIPLHTNNFKF